MTLTAHGYLLRTTTEADLSLAMSWTTPMLRSGFWICQEPGRESFLVYRRRECLARGVGHTGDCLMYELTPLAFFQIEHVGRGTVPPMTEQVRLHWQPAPDASPKKLLRMLTMLVPLVEKALALRGVKAIFFTSHHDTMMRFMNRRLGYKFAGDGGADGDIMAKGVTQS